MIRYEDIKFDCRLYSGYKPCIYGNECFQCDKYEPRGGQPNFNAPPPQIILPKLDKPIRILIIKTGALGDVLRTTTLLNELNHQFTNPHTTWLTSTSAIPLLSQNPLIESLLDFTQENCDKLANVNFDVLINLEKEKAPLEFSKNVSAAVKIGYKSTYWGTADVFNAESVYALLLGISDQLKFYINKKTYPQIICEMTGLTFHWSPYILELSAVGIHKRKDLLNQIPNSQKGLPIVGLNTGCGDVFKTKQWTLNGWSTTAEMLINSNRFNVLLLGGKAEAELNASIKAANKEIIDTGIDNSLEEFAGIVDACDIVVSSDSLGMHVAIARRKRVVALFGSTSEQEIDLFERGEKIITDFPCSPCYLKTCDKNPTCMQALTSKTVVEAIYRQADFLREEN